MFTSWLLHLPAVWPDILLQSPPINQGFIRTLSFFKELLGVLCLQWAFWAWELCCLLFCRVLCVPGTLSSALGKGPCSFSDHTWLDISCTIPGLSGCFIFCFCLSGGRIYFFCQAWLLVWISAEFQGQSVSPTIMESLALCFLTV